MINIGQSQPLSAVQGDLCLCHEDIEATLSVVHEFNLPMHDRESVNGVVTKVEHGEFTEVWVTMSREPYRRDTLYTRVL